MLNEKQAGLEMIAKSREITASLGHKSGKKEDEFDFKNDPRPYLITSKRKLQSTQVQTINLLFSVLFGF